MKAADIYVQGPHSIDPAFMDIALWLKEIAYQLALANEATERFDQERKEEREAEHKALAATLDGIIAPPRRDFD